MKIVECSGTPRNIGRITGEALKDEIGKHINLMSFVYTKENQTIMETLLSTIYRYSQDAMDEMHGIAEGSGFSIYDIYKLNIQWMSEQYPLYEGCTNIFLKGGSDGPLWGKNNDSGDPDKKRPACIRIIRQNNSIPFISISYCGALTSLDCMNAEGLAVGSSSTGSIYKRSVHQPQIHFRVYEGMKKCRNTKEFVEYMMELPVRGKGYALGCIDRKGIACSLEIPCPLVQPRPMNEAHEMCVVNCYQLPELINSDRRTNMQKINANARLKLLKTELSKERKRNIEDMKFLLRMHGETEICRHGNHQLSYTEFSVIGVVAKGMILYTGTNPCMEEYRCISI